MKMAEVKDIAKSAGVKVGKLKKGDLIRSIQLAEGNFDCYASNGANNCDQTGCLWREDCLQEANAA